MEEIRLKSTQGVAYPDAVLHCNIWPEIKQIELFTSRGQSVIWKGSEAIDNISRILDALRGEK